MRVNRVRSLLGIVVHNGHVAFLVRRSNLLFYPSSLFASAATETHVWPLRFLGGGDTRLIRHHYPHRHSR